MTTPRNADQITEMGRLPFSTLLTTAFRHGAELKVQHETAMLVIATADLEL
jgi:hypothetical protein